MKKILSLVLSIIIMFSLCACGGGTVELVSTDINETENNVTEENSIENEVQNISGTDTSKENENLEAAKPNETKKEMKTIRLNEMVTVNTERGTFKIEVSGATIKDEEDLVNEVGILCKLVNVDFKGKYDDLLSEYELFENFHYIEVLDEEGFAIPSMAMSAPPILGYGVGDEIPMGSQAKIAFVIEAEKNVKNLTININKEYTLNVEIESDVALARKLNISTSKNNCSVNGIKDIPLNEMVTVNTERGTFKIEVSGATIKDEEDLVNEVGILCKLVNVDFKGKYDDLLSEYELFENFHYIEVLDEEGFAIPSMAMSAPPILGYGVGDEIPMGSQAKIAFVVETLKSAKHFTIVIDKEYQVKVSLK